MSQRRHSVPSGVKPTSQPENVTTKDAVPSGSSSSPVTTADPGARLFAKADYLAKMTYELGLRAVSSKAEHLERDIQKLKHVTEDNKQFRTDNERRFGDMNREIVAVKRHMDALETAQNGAKADYEEHHRLTMEVLDGFRTEMAGMKSLMDGLSGALAQLPTLQDIKDVENDLEMQQVESGIHTRDVYRAHRRTSSQRYINRINDDTRIKETIESTKRWNMDYKSTPFPDGLFIANYLKQQSKRDPKMAQLLQLALQRQLRLRGNVRAKSRPQSLEEFCEDFCWRDVLDTVEEVLLRDRGRSLRALRALR